MYSVTRGQADVDVAVADLDGIDGYRFGGWQVGGFSGLQVEARAVQPALQGAAVHLALREGDLLVRALVVDGVVAAVLAMHDREGRTVHLRRNHPTAGDVGGSTDSRERGIETHAHAPASTSRASIAAPSRSRSSSTGTRIRSSAKKPRTTSLRASGSGIPRDIR